MNIIEGLLWNVDVLWRFSNLNFKRNWLKLFLLIMRIQLDKLGISGISFNIPMLLLGKLSTRQFAVSPFRLFIRTYFCNLRRQNSDFPSNWCQKCYPKIRFLMPYQSSSSFPDEMRRLCDSPFSWSIGHFEQAEKTLKHNATSRTRIRPHDLDRWWTWVLHTSQHSGQHTTNSHQSSGYGERTFWETLFLC